MAECVCFCSDELSPALPPEIRQAISPAQHGPWHLCALSWTASEQFSRSPLYCQTLLVPEGAYGPLWRAEQVVSYGLSGRSTLTLSSMGDRDMLCVQRTLVDRTGQTVEEQELPLPADWSRYPATDRLLLAGIRLLCGLPLREQG